MTATTFDIARGIENELQTVSFDWPVAFVNPTPAVLPPDRIKVGAAMDVINSKLVDPYYIRIVVPPIQTLRLDFKDRCASRKHDYYSQINLVKKLPGTRTDVEQPATLAAIEECFEFLERLRDFILEHKNLTATNFSLNEEEFSVAMFDEDMLKTRNTYSGTIHCVYTT